ncbi:hypothetical protein [Streptomyces sp. NPDC021212]|uniref:hypothetical protein n=1 Tax=Streptomyces sp. NPDC021212 TaxID=3365118 RepID=UPI003797C0EA
MDGAGGRPLGATHIRRTFDERPVTDFIGHRIFGSGDLHPLSELVAAAEAAGLSIRAVPTSPPTTTAST